MILVLCGWIMPGALEAGWTIYTPYSSMYSTSSGVAEGNTANKLGWLLPNPSGFVLLLIGCVLLTLMQAPRRWAVWALIAYGLAAALYRLPQILVKSVQAPRRYHYYYFAPEQQLPYQQGALAFLGLGLFLSLATPIYGLLAKRKPAAEISD